MLLTGSELRHDGRITSEGSVIRGMMIHLDQVGSTNFCQER